jgi:Fructose-2,6-bisphosphatase
MEIILVRHGEPDYSEADSAGYLGFGRDLSPLSAKGAEQAHAVSRSDLFEKAECVISSPYTRALHTAAIVSANLNLNLTVEFGFHERLPDVGNVLKTSANIRKSFEEYDLCKGVYTSDKVHPWESIELQIARIRRSLDKYGAYNKIIIVTHGELIRRFAAVRLPFCGAVRIEYDENFKFLGWS